MAALAAPAPPVNLTLDSLLAALPTQTPHHRALVERAYHRAEKAHEGVTRDSGEPYFTHCVAVAQILADLKLDSEAIAAGLLHDVVEDTRITVDDLRAEFGDAIASIVDGVTKLKKLPINESDKKGRAADREKEYIRKMMLAMGDDVRVVLVKLADRLHNMRTLGFKPPEKQKKTAQETLDIFAPLANRLGIWQIKWQLEDLSFRYLDPDSYRLIADELDERREDRQKYLTDTVTKLRVELAKNGIDNPTISGRPKHIYSIHKKMVRKELPMGQIYDVRAVRVIVESIPQCYLAMGVVHSLWRPVPGEFDDYIAAPKDNFYKSLHTAVVDDQGRTLEVQIRTWDMHEHAEYGIAAHWRYKEGLNGKADETYNQRLEYLHRLMEFGKQTGDADDFMDALKTDVFKDRVYAFTPKGDVVDLPTGATVVDFAYYIHSEIGHRCRGARVDGKLVPLDYILKTGERVEIVTTKKGGPSLNWLNMSAGIVTTPRARAKINYWFRQQNREKHIQSGRELLVGELKRLGLGETMTFESVARLFNYDKLDEFLAQVGAGEINGGQIASRILQSERREQDAQARTTLRANPSALALAFEPSRGISVMGGSNMMIKMATCCHPMAGDPIIGYVTRGRGIVVHRKDCPNIRAETERLIEVTWGKVQDEQRFEVPIQVIAHDRNGLIRDISTVIADEKISMTDVKVEVQSSVATINIKVMLTSNEQLVKVLSRLESVASVVNARRRRLT